MEANVRPPKLESQKVLGKAGQEYWEEVSQAKKEGKLIVWTTPFYPTDILRAMDIFPVIPENHAATCGVRKVSTELCEIAETHAYPADICSYARTEIGSGYAGSMEDRGVPDQPGPDAVMMSNNQCTTIAKWFEAESRLYNVPFLMIDAPLIHDNTSPDDYARIVNYAKEQLKEHIAFLEELTGRRFDYDRFKECVALTGKIGRLYGEILDMGKNIPSPITFADAVFSLAPVLVLRGTQRGVDCYEALLAELKERVRQGIGAIQDEKYRLYWDDGPVWFELSSQAKTLTALGACPIIGPYPQNWRLSFGILDPDRPLESTAEGVISPYANRAIGWSMDYVTEMIEGFSLDGMVMGASKTCKAYRLRQNDLVKGLEERTGVPAVFFDVDLCDSRLYNDAHFQTRIQAFIEVLESRPKRR